MNKALEFVLFSAQKNKINIFKGDVILWYFFSDCFSTGTNSILEYNHLVKKVVFRVSVLPVIEIVSIFNQLSQHFADVL
jgi:ABC-type polysaccharide/polyol phosphate export permease